MNDKSSSPHDILEISTTATKQEIKEAYRLKAKQLHPDRGGNMSDFIELKHAYDLAIQLVGETPREKTKRVAKIMVKIQKWSDGYGEGTKTFDNIMECKKSNKTLQLIGTFLAGKLSFNGNILISGDISSPLGGLYTTYINGDDILIEGDITNDAHITGKSITANNVFGFIKSQTEPNSHDNKPLYTRLIGKDSIYVHDCSGPVILTAKEIQVGNIKDGVQILADHVIITGDIITKDCEIHAKKTLQITTSDMLGLDDTCQIIIGEYQGSLGALKTSNFSLTDGGIGVSVDDITTPHKPHKLIDFLKQLILSFLRPH